LNPAVLFDLALVGGNGLFVIILRIEKMGDVAQLFGSGLEGFDLLPQLRLLGLFLA
jgi:hypothetical protein